MSSKDTSEKSSTERDQRFLAKLHELEEKLYIDLLTGCRTRQFFYDTYFEYCKKDSWILLLDVENFACVNENHGIDAGDRLLKAIACNLRSFVPRSGYVARVLGDKFLIVVTETPQDKLTSVIDQLSAKVSQSAIEHEGLSVFRNTRLGISELSAAIQPHEALIWVNNALDAAKKEGLPYAFKAEQRDARDQKPSLDHVRRALQNDEITYYVQPIYNTACLDVVGYEALLRWIKPSGTVLGPDQFLDTMIQCYSDGICPPLHRAREVAKWATGQGSFISFNLSGAFLSSKSRENIDWLNEVFGPVPYNQCVIEIVETLIDNRLADISETVERLQHAGVRIAMDDFGVAHSSLLRLGQTTVDIVKIDRQFLVGARHDERNLSILESMASLINAIGARSVLEGIETKQDLDIARNLNVDMVQGFFLGRPKPTQDHDQAIQAYGTMIPTKSETSSDDATTLGKDRCGSEPSDSGN